MTPEIKDLLERNTALLEQNNKILKKLHRYQIWGFWFSLLWYVVLIISPLALYFYVFEPYLEAWKASSGSVLQIFEEMPGIREILEILQKNYENTKNQ